MEGKQLSSGPPLSYGDERIAKDHSLAVRVEAHRLLGELHASDDFSRRPRRTFTPAELEQVYERASDVIRERNRLRHEQVAPASDFIAEIKALADRAIAQQKALPCGGLVENLQRCTNEVQAGCPERDAVWCPRNVLRFYEKHGPPTPQERLEGLGVPEDLAAFVLGAPDQRGRFFDPSLEAVGYVRAWLEDPTKPPHQLLAGGTGVGKSSAAVWALQEHSGRFVSSYGIAAHAGRPDRELWLEKLIDGARLLVVDEVGGEPLGEWGKAAIARIAYERGARRTIWTANVEAEVLVARYTDRFLDRVKGPHSWIVPGQSMRRSDDE